MFSCDTNDLIVALECFNSCSYLLSGYTKKDVESNLVVDGASSSILVQGFSWLYGLSEGHIDLQAIVNALINRQMYNSLVISIALIFLTVGIGFKLCATPSHQWIHLYLYFINLFVLLVCLCVYLSTLVQPWFNHN